MNKEQKETITNRIKYLDSRMYLLLKNLKLQTNDYYNGRIDSMIYERVWLDKFFCEKFIPFNEELESMLSYYLGEALFDLYFQRRFEE